MVAGQWYRDGSVTVANGNAFVFGAGTAWATQAEVGDGFAVTENGVSKERYEVVQVLDNYTLKLNTPYQGESGAGLEYALERNWTGRWSLPTKTVADTAELNREMRRLLETQLKGDKGDPGADGNRIHDGSGPAPVSLGLDGDYYMDNLTWDYYRKVAGIWTLIGNIQGETGEPGLRGAQIHDGDGPPLVTVGLDGDYYLDRRTGDYYRKVAQTGWHKAMNLMGPQGESIKGDPGESIKGDPGIEGSQWLTGATEPPDVSHGRNNDMYMVTTGTGRGRFYKKLSGLWVFQGAVQGQPGNVGATGPVGLNPRGAWSASVGYEARDFVSRNGSSWYALKPSLGVTPAEGEYWTILSAKGESGDGSGDMATAVYDPNKTGTVDAARVAGHARTADQAATAATAEYVDPVSIDHNAMGGLQDGKVGNEKNPNAERYHITADQHAAIFANVGLSGANYVIGRNEAPSYKLYGLDIYVDSLAGSDSTGDGKIDTPFQTIGRALQQRPNIVNHYFRILLTPGLHELSSPVWIPFFGGWIRFEATDPANPPIIQAAYDSNLYMFYFGRCDSVSFSNVKIRAREKGQITNHGVQLSASKAGFENCEFENFNTSAGYFYNAGISISGSSLDLVNCKFINCGSSVLINSNNVLSMNTCTIEDCTLLFPNYDYSMEAKFA